MRFGSPVSNPSPVSVNVRLESPLSTVVDDIASTPLLNLLTYRTHLTTYSLLYDIDHQATVLPSDHHLLNVRSTHLHQIEILSVYNDVMTKLIDSAPQRTYFPNFDSDPPRALVGSITQLMLAPLATRPADFDLLLFKVLSKHLSPHLSDFDLRLSKVPIRSGPLGLLLGITLPRLPLDYQLYIPNLNALRHHLDIVDGLRN
jgi:hypothetical protein